MRATDANISGSHRNSTALLAAAAAIASLIAVLTLGAGPAAAKAHKVYVKSVSLSQTTAPAGSPIQVNYKVRNRGSSESGRRTVRFFLTRDAASGLKGFSLGSAKVPAGIEAKRTKSARKRITIPPFTPPGSYLVTACISGKCKATTVRVVVTGANPLGPAQLVLTPSTYDYGAVMTSGGSAALSFTVTNVGNVASGVITTSISGDEFLAFSIGPDSCAGSALAGGASCTIKVTFTPSASMQYSGELDVLASPGAPPGTVFATLEGTGV